MERIVRLLILGLSLVAISLAQPCIGGNCPGGSGGTSGGGTASFNVVTKTAPYTVDPGDNGKWIVMNGGNATLPPAPPSAPWAIVIQNLNATTSVVLGNGNNINAAGNLELELGQAVLVASDGLAYYAQSTTACGYGTRCTATGAKISVAADPLVMAARTDMQSANNPMLCTTTSSSSTTYTAVCNPTLAGYVDQQTLFWAVNLANSTSTPSINIDGRGAKSLVKQDGTALSASDIKAASYRIWYDGTLDKVHVVEAGLGGGTGYWGTFQGVYNPANIQVLNGGASCATGLFSSPILCDFAGANWPLNNYKAQSDGAVRNLCASPFGAQPGTGTLVVALYKNNTLTPVVATIPAGAAAGSFTCNTSSEPYTAGDLLQIRITNNASSVTYLASYSGQIQ